LANSEETEAAPYKRRMWSYPRTLEE